MSQRNSNASPPRNSRSRQLQPNLDPLATPQSFFRSNPSSVSPSILSSPPPPFKLPYPPNRENHAQSINNFFASPILESSPFYDARSSIESSSSNASSLEEKTRQWRNDAYFKNLYETAVFWGNKVMTMTGDSNDALWLAQVHYNMGQYVRAQKLIWNLIDSSVVCRFLAAKCC
ncbi:8049_t:CDS:2, partial [Racocetra persica]